MAESVKLVSLTSAAPKDDAPVKFRKGMPVRLRGDLADAVIMTVRNATKTKIVCDWHDADKTLCCADFEPAMLVEVELEDVPEDDHERD
jgi:hypothetical protein